MAMTKEERRMYEAKYRAANPEKVKERRALRWNYLRHVERYLVFRS
jgi:hypothetical protein